MFKIALRDTFPIQSNSQGHEAQTVFQNNELEISVRIQGESLNELGMLYDFFDLKKLLQSILLQFCKQSEEQLGHSQLLHYMQGCLADELPSGLVVEHLAVRISRGTELAIVGDGN